MSDRPVPADALEEYVTPLSADADGTAEVPDALADALAGASVVGLGEATHGTAEFVALRRHVLEHLVTEQGCRLFALEANYSEALALDEYVVHGDGDPRDALAGLHVWPWRTAEMLALVEWLRAFNADRPVADRVRVRGFDAQYVEGPAAALREFLADVDPEFLAEVTDRLAILESEDVRGERYNVAAEHVEAAEETVAALEKRFGARAEAYAASASGAAVERARRHLRTMAEAVAFASESHDAAEPHGAVDRRDAAMADLVADIATDADGPVALWGHNGHLLPGETAVRGDWFTPMGQHLAERYGDGYRVVATDFNRGSFTAIPDPLDVDDPEPQSFSVGAFHEDPPYRDEPWAPERTLNGALADHDADLCYFDVAGAAADPSLEDWLAAHHPVRDVGNAFWDESAHLEGYRLPEEAAGLLFVTESSPTAVFEAGEDTDG